MHAQFQILVACFVVALSAPVEFAPTQVRTANFEVALLSSGGTVCDSLALQCKVPKSKSPLSRGATAYVIRPPHAVAPRLGLGNVYIHRAKVRCYHMPSLRDYQYSGTLLSHHTWRNLQSAKLFCGNRFYAMLLSLWESRALSPGEGFISTSLGSAHSFPQQSSDRKALEEPLEEYLNRIGLERLALRRLELVLARDPNIDSRKRMAARLADKYRIHFFANVNSEDNRHFIRKAETLVRDYPNLVTEKLQIAISHARYVVAEKKFLVWWKHGAQPQQRDAIVSNFSEIRSTLRQQIDFNNADQRKTIAALPFSDAENASRQERLDQIESRLVHANYLLGWTSYFLGVAPFEVNDGKLAESQAAFYRTLQIEQPEAINKIDSKWLDFSVPLSRRTLIGLGMVYTAQAKPTSGRFCFTNAAKLSGNTNNLSIWEYNSFAFGKQWPNAVNFAQEYEPLQNEHHATNLFWKSVLESGLVAKTCSRDANSRAQAATLQRLGLIGLLRQVDGEAINSYIDQNNIKLGDDNVEDLWIKGVLTQSIANDDNNMLEKARNYLNSAINISDPTFDQGDITRIKYLIAVIDFQLREFNAALDQVAEIPSALLQAEPELMERMHWLRCRSLVELCRVDKRLTGRTLAAMNELASLFPRTKHSSNIEFERIRLSNNLLPAGEALENLFQISADVDYFAKAQFEIVKTQYRIWNKLFQSAAKSEEYIAFNNLVAYNKKYLEIAELSAEDKLSSLYYVLDAALRRSGPSETVDNLIDQAERIAKQVEVTYSKFQPKIVYYRFLTSRKFDRPHSAQRTARWLADNSGNAEFEIAALTFLAQSAKENGTTGQELVSIYEALTERLGTERRDIANSRNARVAASRLVALYVDANQLEKADRLNVILLETEPNQRQFLLNAARIKSRLGRFENSIPIWRRLASGSSPGSEIWFESKYELIRCLKKNDPELAQKILRQTVILGGEIPENWRVKFDEQVELIEK